MRRLIRRVKREERGAVAIIVALSMTGLIGFTAIAVDVGAMYVERAQLQNGADAAALAVAQQCAIDKNCADPAAQSAKVPVAQGLANQNANDGTAIVSDVVFPSTNSVRVDVAAKDADAAAGSLALTFAPVLGIDSAAVAAHGKAAWGIPVSGPAQLPLAFAPCVFKPPGGGVQVIRSQTSAAPNCPGGVPGGFSWLASDPAGSCSALVDVNQSETGGDTGNDLPSGCISVLTSLKDKTVLLPVYNSVVGTGSNAVYDIAYWAAFRLMGYKFGGGVEYRNMNYYPDIECKGDCNGLIGEFIAYASLDDRFQTGGAPDGGASIVTMIP